MVDCRLTVLVEAPLLTEVVLRPTVEFCLVAVAFVLLFLTDEPDLLVVPFIIISEPDFSTAWRDAVELVTEALLSVRIKPGSILEPDKVAAWVRRSLYR